MVQCTCSFLGLVYNVSKGKQLSWFSLFLMGLFVALIIVHVYRCTLHTCTVYFVSYFYTVDEWKSSVFSIEFQLFSNCSAYCSASAKCWPYGVHSRINFTVQLLPYSYLSKELNSESYSVLEWLLTLQSMLWIYFKTPMVIIIEDLR